MLDKRIPITSLSIGHRRVYSAFILCIYYKCIIYISCLYVIIYMYTYIHMNVWASIYRHVCRYFYLVGSRDMHESRRRLALVGV